jgi:hypothetical protein
MEIVAISSGPKAPKKLASAVDHEAPLQLEFQHRPNPLFAFHSFGLALANGLRGRVVHPQVELG